MREAGAVGFIGAGALAGFLVEGLVAAGTAPESLWICNRADDSRLERFRHAGLHCTRDKGEVLAAARTILLLVKPRDAARTLREMAPRVRRTHLVISCMAGVPTAFIEQALRGRPRVVRAMPNVACAVRASVTAVAPGRHAAPEDVDAAVRLLEAVGLVTVVGESAMDAVTAVFGSGPAYAYFLMEAMTEAAGALGLTGPEVRRLVVHTVLGAAQLAAATERPPQELRLSVSSKGGTTVAATEVLESRGVRQALVAAVARAAARSREMGAAWGDAAALAEGAD